MKQLLLSIGVCASMLLYETSFAQCPTGYYSSVSTTNGSSGNGANSLSNRDGLVDGDLNTAATITSTNSTPATPAVIFIDVTLNAPVPANTYFYFKANDLSGVTIDTYNGTTLVSSPDVTVTTKTVYGFSFFELRSTQPVTRFRVTFTNSSGAQTRQFYEFYSGTPCDSPLPVSLVSFTANPVANKTVQVNWVTGLERDNDYFTVERSKDLRAFEVLGQVKAKEGTTGHSYSFVDENPHSGTSYYRLRQTDLNGTSSAFPAVSVVLRGDSYGVFPNPVTDGKFTLRLDEPQTAVLGLYGIDGQWVPLQKTGADDGLLLLKTAKKLSTGVYILKVEERAQIRTHRLVVE